MNEELKNKKNNLSNILMRTRTKSNLKKEKISDSPRE